MVAAYKKIQHSVDQLVAQNGSEKTARILESAVRSKTSLNFDNELRTLIIQAAIEIFGLSHHRFKSDTSEFYRKSRECCYYLIHEHTCYSLREIADYFQCKTHGAVFHGANRAKNIFTLPKIDPGLFQKYSRVEKEAKKFIKEHGKKNR